MKLKLINVAASCVETLHIVTASLAGPEGQQVIVNVPITREQLDLYPWPILEKMAIEAARKLTSYSTTAALQVKPDFEEQAFA